MSQKSINQQVITTKERFYYSAGCSSLLRNDIASVVNIAIPTIIGRIINPSAIRNKYLGNNTWVSGVIPNTKPTKMDVHRAKDDIQNACTNLYDNSIIDFEDRLLSDVYNIIEKSADPYWFQRYNELLLKLCKNYYIFYTGNKQHLIRISICEVDFKNGMILIYYNANFSDFWLYNPNNYCNLLNRY